MDTPLNEAWKALLMSARTVALAIMASSMQLSSESGTLLLERRAPAIAVSRGTEMSLLLTYTVVAKGVSLQLKYSLKPK